MKKIITLVLMFLLSFAAPGCKPIKYLMTGLKLQTVREVEKEHGYMAPHYDYLDKNLYFSATPTVELITHRITAPNLIDRAYATSVPTVIVNGIISDSWELRFDTEIKFNGSVIPAGTDLFEIPSLKKRFRTNINHNRFPESYDFVSDDKLLDEIEFGSLEFRATIFCRTNADEEFQASTDVVIRK